MNSVMGARFARGLAELMCRGVLALDLGMFAFLRAALLEMKVLGGILRDDPAHIERYLAILEMVGNVCIFVLMLHSVAAIFCAMGRICQLIFVVLISALTWVINITIKICAMDFG